MMLQAVKCVAVAGLLAMAGLAQASTVTFDSLTNPGDWQYTTDTYTEQGYSFAATLRTDGYSLYSFGTSNPLNADPTGATLGENYDGQALVVSRAGGGTFTLASFDLAFNADGDNPGQVRFDYTDALGAHSTQLSFTDQYQLHTFTFGYTGVTSFTLWDDDFQLDNVVLDADVIAVPEPAPWTLLMLGGLVLLAWRRRA